MSHYTFTLLPEQQRPVLICTMHIDRDGRLGAFRVNEGMMRSHHKMSYQSVSEWLDNPADAAVPATVMIMLEQLPLCATAQHQQRQEHVLVLDARPSYF